MFLNMNVIYKKIFYTTNKIEIQDLWTDNLFLYFSDQSDIEIDTTIQWLISEKHLKNKTINNTISVGIPLNTKNGYMLLCISPYNIEI